MLSAGLPWLLVALACATPALAFAEWLIGDQDVQRAKDRLADWYVFVEEGDWSRFIASSAIVTEAFLQRVLGIRLISRRSVAVWFFVSAPLSLTAFSVNHSADLVGVSTMLAGVVSVFVIDYLFLILGRMVLRRLAQTTTPRGALAFLLYAALASYLAVGSYFAAGSYARLTNLRVVLVGTPHDWLLRAISWPLVFSDVVGSGGFSLPGAILMVIPAALSTLLFGFVVLSAGLIYLLRAKARRAIALFIERISGLRSGALTAASTTLTAAVAVVTALDHARH